MKKIKSIISVFVLFAIVSTYSLAFALFSASSLVSMTNDQRSQGGLATLSTNQALANAALAKANDMFAKGYFAHTSPDGKTPWDFIHQAGYNYTYAGENLAISYDDASDLMQAWMNSASHRDNILSPNFKEIGIAVVSGNFNGSETIIVAQEFGAPINSSVQSAQSSNTVPSAQTKSSSSPVAIQPSFNILQEKSKISPTSIFAAEQVDFAVTISGEVKTFELTIGSQKFNILETKNVVVQGSEKTYTLTKKIDETGMHEVTVLATDAAGNKKSVSLGELEVKPAVITNATQENSRSLFAGFKSTASIVGVVILAGMVISSATYLIIRRNKLQKIAKTALATWEF